MYLRPNYEADSAPAVWLAHMNLILAVGAKQSHLIGAEWVGDDRVHLLYMKRAVRLLALKDTVMIISAPELPLVQAVSVATSLISVIVNEFMSNCKIPRPQHLRSTFWQQAT